MHTPGSVHSFDELRSMHGMAGGGDNVVDSMNKALATTNSGPGGIESGPLMLENLDSLMTEVLVTEKHFKLFKFFSKVPSAQPYYEYNKHTSFGANRGSLGFAQGGGPTGRISAFERLGIYNKFLGVRGGVTHQMLQSAANGGAFEDPNMRENRDRTLELFSRMERELIFGNKAILDEDKTEVNIDGLLTIMERDAAENVVDLEGAAFSFDNLDESAVNLVKRGKMISVDPYSVFMSTHVSQGINEQYAAREVVRHNKDNAPRLSATPGFQVPEYQSQFGSFKLDHSILLEEIEDSSALDVATSGAPAAPAAPALAAAALVGSNLPADTYYYWVSAFNDTGESLPTAGAAGVAIIADQEASITITHQADATGFRIYRSTVDDVDTARWIARVPVDTGGANVVYLDHNQWMTVDANGA
jgi:hypothetical protein